MTERVPEIPCTPVDFDDAIDARIRASIARRVADSPDANGETPFADELVRTPSTGATANDLSRAQMTARQSSDPDVVTNPYVQGTDPHHRGRSRWLVAASAVVLFAVAAALATRTSAPPDAQELPTLEAMAARLGTQPDHRLADGEYWSQEVTIRSFMNTADVLAYDFDQQYWTAADGTGRLLGRIYEVRRDGTRTEQDTPNGDRTETEPGSLSFVGFTYDEFRALPQEPGALRDLVITKIEAVDDDVPETFAEIARSAAATPGTRQAALEVLISLGGGVTGEVIDPEGRPGISVSGVAREGPWTVILDPRSGVPLAVFVGYPTGPDGLADLDTARTRTIFGPQGFTDSVS